MCPPSHPIVLDYWNTPMLNVSKRNNCSTSGNIWLCVGMLVDQTESILWLLQGRLVFQSKVMELCLVWLHCETLFTEKGTTVASSPPVIDLVLQCLWEPMETGRKKNENLAQQLGNLWKPVAIRAQTGRKKKKEFYLSGPVFTKRFVWHPGTILSRTKSS